MKEVHFSITLVLKKNVLPLVIRMENAGTIPAVVIDFRFNDIYCIFFRRVIVFQHNGCSFIISGVSKLRMVVMKLPFIGRSGKLADGSFKNIHTPVPDVHDPGGSVKTKLHRSRKLVEHEYRAVGIHGIHVFKNSTPASHSWNAHIRFQPEHVTFPGTVVR
ncbi:hypothetical protein ACR79P_19775 [Sphingobacterium spiritivorum]|uniref:hypothetical protein n=1 Tax=Sphingobacterium spiritivorum TaxID=258 RepID=UPI003DA24124